MRWGKVWQEEVKKVVCEIETAENNLKNIAEEELEHRRFRS